MKAKLFRMSMMATVLIFLITGASWADDGKQRHHRRDVNKQYRSGHHKEAGYGRQHHDKLKSHGRSEHYYGKHHDRHLVAQKVNEHIFRRHRDYHRAQKHALKRHHKYYRSHRSSQKIYSYWASAFEPGWCISIKTKNRW